MFNFQSHDPYINKVLKLIILLLCVIVFSITFYIYNISIKDEGMIVEAEKNMKEYKWSKKTVETDTTINAAYLWPDEINPEFTAIYRDGKRLSEEKMVTVTTGSVYHFRGMSDKSILYAEVYVGLPSDYNNKTDESKTWYNLLSSKIRTEFEKKGWTWQTGWEYTDRAYLDTDNNRIMIKTNDPTAVLYGIGLYLDNEYKYSGNEAFILEGTEFEKVFGNTKNLFASAFEHYYTKGGQLRSTCPKIYSMIADIMMEFDDEKNQIENSTTEIENSTTEIEEPNTKITNETVMNETVLMTELLDYVNTQRTQSGLNTVTWDSADDDNIRIRMKEITELFSQNRPDGTDAFTAYTDAVMCEIRIMNANTTAEIFDSAASYFLMKNLTSFNCAIYENIIILIFVW